MTPTALPHTLNLQRFPSTSDKTLRAWNAADEYILQQLTASDFDLQTRPLLIVNDQFGALNCCLAQAHRINWTDSLTAELATAKNLDRLPRDGVTPHASIRVAMANKQLKFFLDETVSSADSGLLDELQLPLCLLRIPKHLSLLDMQLRIICQLLTDSGAIIAGGMSKEIHRSTIQLFERYFSSVTTSLARKKARLILASHPKPAARQRALVSNDPVPSANYLKDIDLNCCGLPGVFSKDALDMGTRAMINNLPPLSPGRWLDLGCGTGMIGCFLQKQSPESKLVFSDESQLAVLSAQLSFAANFPQKSAEFVQSNLLTSLTGEFDAIFCNPPFHQQNARLKDIALQMFKGSARKLTPDGALFVIANRHLRYQGALQKYFARVRPLSKDPKFILWQATLPKR